MWFDSAGIPVAKSETRQVATLIGEQVIDDTFLHNFSGSMLLGLPGISGIGFSGYQTTASLTPGQFTWLFPFLAYNVNFMPVGGPPPPPTTNPLACEPQVLSFTATPGTTSPAQSVTCTNTSTAPWTDPGDSNAVGAPINGQNNATFTVTGDSCSSQVIPARRDLSDVGGLHPNQEWSVLRDDRD